MIIIIMIMIMIVIMITITITITMAIMITIMITIMMIIITIIMRIIITTTDVFSCQAGTVRTLLGDRQTSTVAAIAAASIIGAPLLEEFTYRGFLLPSLTRWLPTPAAVSYTIYNCLLESSYHYRSCHSL